MFAYNVRNLSYWDYSEYAGGVYVWKIVSPILLVVGTIGNLLSVIVLARKNMRRTTVSVYLTVLACSDVTVLYTGLLRQWILVMWGVDVRLSSNPACKIHIYMTYLSLHISAWTLVGVTVERAVRIWCPYGVKWCDGKRVKLLISLAVAFILCGLNSPLLSGIGITVAINLVDTFCLPVDQTYLDYFKNVWPRVDLCVYCFAPFCIIIIANVSIIIKIFRNKRNMGQFDQDASEIALSSTKKRRSNVSSVTVMLLILNTVFIITTSPVSIYLIGERYWNRKDPYEVAKQKLAWACVNMLQYSNNCSNFFIYCMSGSKFRRELLSMFSCKDRKGQNRSSNIGSHANNKTPLSRLKSEF